MSGHQAVTIRATRTTGDTRRWTEMSLTTPRWVVALGWAAAVAAIVVGAVLGSTGLALFLVGTAAVLTRFAVVAVRFAHSDRAAEQALLARREAAAAAAGSR
jgi:predicted phage tail protein